MSISVLAIVFTLIMIIPIYNAIAMRNRSQLYIDSTILLLGWIMLIIVHYFTIFVGSN